ncbi:asparagine synthase (glutamine-hydrolyzing) [Pseudomonadota bacterium]
MCGIAGGIHLNGGQSPGQECITRMVEALRRRGPDSNGVFNKDSASIGMSRLAIMDLDSGQQPFVRDGGNISLVCNGEIYNQDEIRQQFQPQEYTFETGSDAEVILPLYQKYGVDCVKHLRGMFGFALWDANKKRMLIARDRLGIKPLFYTIQNNTLYFSSEIKSLRAAGVVPREMDEQALQDYLSFSYIPTPRTIYKGVFKLPPGHFLLVENGSYTIAPYWKLDTTPDHSKSEEEWNEELTKHLRSAISSHLMSDVPLGAFLSGGIDSSLVVALMREMTDQPIKTFTIGFGGQKGGYLDERGYAEEVSKRYNTEHQAYQVEPHFEEVLDDILEAFDEPFADDSIIPSYYLCEQVGKEVKVALSGLGGDELFAGYERYLGMKLSQQYNQVPSILRKGVIEPIINNLPEQKSGHYRVNHMKRFIRAASLSPAARYREMTSTFNNDLQQQLLSNPGQVSVTPEEQALWERAPTLVDGALAYDFSGYLPEDILALSDRLSMWHSLELRVPLLDNELVEFAARMPAKYKIKLFEKKAILRKAARPFLPDSIFNHRKQGFCSPMAAWLRTDLKEPVMNALAPKQLAMHGMFSQEVVDKLFDDHLNRRELNDKKIFTVFMFQKWFEKFMA